MPKIEYNLAATDYRSICITDAQGKGNHGINEGIEPI